MFLFLFFGYSDNSLRLGRLSAVPLRGFSPPGRFEAVRRPPSCAACLRSAVFGVCLSVGALSKFEGRPKRHQPPPLSIEYTPTTAGQQEQTPHQQSHREPHRGQNTAANTGHHLHKEKPRNASGAVCVGFISTVSRFRQVARRETESSKRERTFLTPPHAKVKRFVSVVLVYCVAMSGCPFFNAAVSIRELVTVL